MLQAGHSLENMSWRNNVRLKVSLRIASCDNILYVIQFSDQMRNFLWAMGKSFMKAYSTPRLHASTNTIFDQ